MSELLHSKLGKYTLLEELGAGGMGAVYRSFHPQLNRPVAIKVILGNATSELRQRFVREAQMAAQLSHPHIVRVFDVDEDRGIPYLVMDLIEGASLAQLLNERPPGLAEAVRIAIQLADALHYAHEHGVLHRDLKPSNVLLRPDGEVVLVDFGLARPVTVADDDQLTQTGVIVGTLAYMAPEQLLASPLDRRTDIYALGILLYRMVTGRLPFEGNTSQIMYGHVHTQPLLPSQTGVLVPPEFDTLLLQMLAKDPAQRVATMADVAAHLRYLQQHLAGGVVAYTGPTQARTVLLTQTINHPYPADPFAPRTTAAPTGALPSRGQRNWAIWLMGLGGGLLALSVVAYLLLSGNQVQPTPTPAPEVSGIGTDQPETPAPEPTARPTAKRKTTTPVSATQPTADQAATAAPEASAVLTYTGVTSRRIQSILDNNEEHLWFYGLVTNQATELRETIKITIGLYDRDNQELDYESGYAQLDFLAPGEHSGFIVIFDREVPEFDHYTIQLDSAPPGFSSGYYSHALELSDDKRVEGSFGYTLRGNVKNTGEYPLSSIEVDVIFFNAQDEVVDTTVGFADISGLLEPGETARFEVPGSLDESAVRHEIQLEGAQQK